MYKFMKDLDEDSLAKKMDEFDKTHYIKRTEYSTCPYTNELFHKVYHCVMIEYKQHDKKQ